MLATALAPVIGYDAAAKLAKEALAERPDDPRAGPRAGHSGGRPRRPPRSGPDDPSRERTAARPAG